MSNVCEKDWPPFNWPESHACAPDGSAVSDGLAALLGSSVTVWGITPAFTHWTVVPRATVIAAGWNSLEFVILTVTVAPPAEVAPEPVGGLAEALVHPATAINVGMPMKASRHFMCWFLGACDFRQNGWQT